MKRTFLKRLFIPVLCLAMLMAVPAFAAESIPTPPEPTPDSTMTYGTLSKLADGRVQLKNDNADDPLNDIILTISKETLILDAATGDPVALDKVKEGEMVYAYTTNYMTMSLPPIAGAKMLLVNIPADYTVPTYLQVTGITKSGDNTVVSTDRMINLTLTKDCNVFPYLTKNIVTADSLTPGTRILAWYDVVATSYPGQATPSKVMVFPYEYRGYLDVADKTEMLPLRDTCEQFDLTCKWDGKTKSVTVLSGEDSIVTFVLGQETVKLGENEVALCAPLSAEKGAISLSAQDIAIFLNIYVH